jgi:adenine-specific DNA-methyltransferase
MTAQSAQLEAREALDETIVDLVLRDGESAITLAGAAKGVVYTKPWVVDLILDLAGYRPERDLASLRAVEPSAGEGAFLLPMIRRLLVSLCAHGRPITDARHAIYAYELDDRSAALVVSTAEQELRQHEIDSATALSIASGWVTVGYYLLASPEEGACDIVVGNPPYIRYDDLPEGGIRRLQVDLPDDDRAGRHLHRIHRSGTSTAQRWKSPRLHLCRSVDAKRLGAELRQLVAAKSSLDVMIEMHKAPAFEN